jgi:zinc transporter ZupT
MDTMLIIAAVLLFVVTFLAAFLAKSFKPSTYLIYAQAFASGAFIGVAILHFIPRAVACFRQTTLPISNYSPYSLIIVFVFLLFILSELVGSSPGQTQHPEDEFSATDLSTLVMHNLTSIPSRFLLFCVLAFLLAHSIIVGLAIYFQHPQHSAIVISLLVNASVEKFVEAFAVTLLLRRHQIFPWVFWSFIVVYASTTSVTILLLGTANWHDNVLLAGIFISISAGVFLFIGTLLWRRTFMTPFDWRKSELVVISLVFVGSVALQALTCIVAG